MATITVSILYSIHGSSENFQEGVCNSQFFKAKNRKYIAVQQYIVDSANHVTVIS